MIAAEVFIVLVVLLAIAGAYLAGVARGRGLGRRTAASSASLCPCGHQWGAHKKGLECMDRVYRSGDGWRHCACTRYHGPEVLMTSDFFGPGAIGT